MQINVAGKKIQASGRTDLFVQNEINAGPIEFIFSNPDALLTSTLTYKLYYSNNNEEFDYDLLTYAAQTSGFKLTWNPSAAATSCAGRFVFNITAINSDDTLVWKTTACAIAVPRDIDGQVLQFEGNLEQLLHSFNTHLANTGIHVTSTDKATWNAKYDKPATGIPESDLSSAVATKLNKQDTFEMSLDGSTYVFTFTLKNTDGTVIKTDSVDFPMESVVVSGSYDSVNKKIILTLKNGSTIDVPVGDLISGLATEADLEAHTGNAAIHVTAQKKAEWDAKADTEDIPTTLAELTGDATHRVVTDVEKAGWNAKYDKPATGVPESDLSAEVQTKLNKQGTITDVKVDGTSVVEGGVAAIDLTGKVDKETGKSLMSTEEHTKLSGIETGADVTDAANVKIAGAVMGVKVDNTELTKDSDGKVNVDLSGKVDKVTGSRLMTNAEGTKLEGIEAGAEVNPEIQKNGVEIEPVEGVINIIVPIDAEDVGALPDTTKYGASASLTIDSSTYVITYQLKDQDGNSLGSAQTIDLPLESVVVSGSYNASTKKVVLTLQNGSTIEFSVADLVSGLVTETTFLAHVNNTSVHVGSGEKAAWNAKEDAANKVTSFQTTPDNNHYPSEKLVKDSLDDKVSYQDVVSVTGQATNKAISQKKFTDDMDTKANASDLTSHTGNTSNPHNVTKAQVGLGNVPNTDFTSTIADHETRISAIENSDSLIKVTAYHANSFISGLTVQVKQGSTVRYTGTTNANGYCEIRVANGNYTVHGVYDADYTTVIDADVVAPKFGEVACRIVGLKTGEMTWSLFQQYVQDGSIKSVLAIGDEVTVSRGNTDLTFQHVAFDKMTTSPASTHNSVIMMKDLLSDTIQFDREEAFIYAQQEMPAGTYHVNLYKASMIYYLNAGLQNKDLQFTITTPIPAGGQIMVTGGDFRNTTTVAGLVLTSYASRGATSALETGIACSEGTSGTDLGSANTVANSGKVNSTDRCMYGSNRWKWSALRQWLNSDQPRGSWWTPQSSFDRKPSQADSLDGWLYGLNADLLAVIKPVKNIQVLNWFDGGINEETEDYFFVPSMSQVYMTATLTEGACWDWYDSKANGGNSDLTTAGTGADSNRIKKRNGSAYYWWLRTPYSSYSHFEWGVSTTGAYNSSSAYGSGGVAPACVIA